MPPTVGSPFFCHGPGSARLLKIVLSERLLTQLSPPSPPPHTHTPHTPTPPPLNLPSTPPGQSRWMSPTTPKTYKAGDTIKLQVRGTLNHSSKHHVSDGLI